MVGNKKVLALITARGGSKGVKRKNIRLVANKPLIAWTIDAAKSSKFIDKIVVSSEDEEILEISKKLGAETPFIRPKELSTDTTPGIDPVIHALNTINEKFDYVLLLQPTSPFRSSEDIDNALQLCSDSEAPACVSVTETSKSPFWTYYLLADKGLKPVIHQEKIAARRQDLPKTFALNGALYIAETRFLLEQKTFLHEDTIAYVMPDSRSIDIDTELDLAIADYLLKTGLSQLTNS